MLNNIRLICIIHIHNTKIQHTHSHINTQTHQRPTRQYTHTTTTFALEKTKKQNHFINHMSNNCTRKTVHRLPKTSARSSCCHKNIFSTSTGCAISIAGISTSLLSQTHSIRFTTTTTGNL